MSKRRFSDIATTVFRAHDYRHPQRRGSCRACSTLGPVPDFYSDNGVRPDVSTMATGAAASPVDDLLRSTIPADSFWPSDAMSPRSEPGPSRSASIVSKLDRSGALPSLSAASPALSPKGGIFFLRSDAESLNEVHLPALSNDQHHLSPLRSTSFNLHAFATSPEQADDTLASSPSPDPLQTSNRPSTATAPTLTSSPCSMNVTTDSMPSRSARSGRPTLTRLNTSEMLRTQTTTALEPAPIRPANRRSPTALKLQLDTSVPRRSATLSSYPHCKSTSQRTSLHPALTLLSPTTPVRHDFGMTIAGSGAESASANFAARSHAVSNGTSSEARLPDTNADRDNFSFESVDFEVSTILPDFLYLGPDVQSEQAVSQLQTLGVRRVLNVACEIDDHGPLKLRERFDRYLKIPMLDSVEAKGVQDSIEEACNFLDDARLRSQPVYVHCKAGKSRSVTIVIAYLIHALGWTLQRSYAHVGEKRGAICPNIGFVAELMRYEEKELKLARSTGIYGDPIVAPPASAAKFSSSSQMLPSCQQGEDAAAASPTNKSSPTLSTPLPQDTHKHLFSNNSSTLAGSLSKSSPDLPSVTFSSTTPSV